MMSKKQWLVLLSLLITYLLLGACFFYEIETREELRRREIERLERLEIEELLNKHYVASFYATQEEIFEKLATYCGKPMTAEQAEDLPFEWDYYHCLFFVITVATTVGYGNLAPTTMFGRIFMIFYAVVGIPISGIVMVTLGDFFGNVYRQLYLRWKTTKMNVDAAKLGLIAQIILYLVPGFTFFIFVPSVIIMIFEGWDYDVAVYYAFVTLTTIGFGDFVAGVNRSTSNNRFGEVYCMIYKIFLLVWIIIGLGYVVMVIGFITRGMRSKKMHQIEHKLAMNIKRTPNKIRAMRALLHEIILMRTKPVYKKHSICPPRDILERSTSCPEIYLMYERVRNESPTMVRRRALSETLYYEDSHDELPRVQSDSDLSRIDRELTFTEVAQQNTDFLFRVSNILDEWRLGGGDACSVEEEESCRGIDGFSDEEILESEQRYPSQWTIHSSTSQIAPKKERPRTKSEVTFPYEDSVYESTKTWTNNEMDSKHLQEMRERAKYGRCRSRTLPVQQKPLVPTQPSLFKRIKKIIKKDNSSDADLEKQQIKTPKLKRHRAFSEAQDYVEKSRHRRPSCFSLQNTKCEFEDTLAELIFAFAEVTEPKRKLGTASLTPPTKPSTPQARRLPIRSAFQSRRASMIPSTLPVYNPSRRLSLMPSMKENLMTAPPAYSPNVISSTGRRFSLKPVSNAMLLNAPSPVQRQRMRSYKDSIRESDSKD